jgi:hypothetical protein
MLPALAVAALLATLSGCARLNQWLEGTAGEEEKKDKLDPAKTLAEQKEALAGTNAGKRAGAVKALIDLALAKPPTNAEQAKALEEARPEALTLAVGLLDDADAKVCGAALGGFGGATAFAEKTEDERQLDPEGYDRQLNLKRKVLTDGLPKLVKVLQGNDAGLRHGALVLLYQLAKPPLVSGDAKKRAADQMAEALKLLVEQAAQPVVAVALDAKMPTDVRLLAMEDIAAFRATEAAGGLEPLLADVDANVRARAALAMAEAGGGLGQAKSKVEPALAALTNDATQPEDVKWRAALALGALGSSQTSGLKQPYLPTTKPDPKKEPDKSDGPGMAPLEAYRTSALARSSADRAEVGQLNAGVDKVAAEAEAQLADERKKGYR